jgi:hypothetical protein
VIGKHKNNNLEMILASWDKYSKVEYLERLGYRRLTDQLEQQTERVEFQGELSVLSKKKCYPFDHNFEV